MLSSLRSKAKAITVFLAILLPSQVFADLDPARAATVHMVVWRGCEEACQAFVDYFDDRKLPVKVTVTDVGRDKSKFEELRDTLIAEHPDLVVTWGTSVSVGLIGTRSDYGRDTALGDIPVLFMIVADPVRSDLIESESTSGRTMVTGTRNRVPEETQLQLIQNYMELRHVGVINDPKELNSSINTDLVRKIGDEMGFRVTALEYRLNSEGKPDAGQIPELMAELKARGVNAVYVGSSSFNLAQRDVFTRAAIDNGLPVFSAYAQMVQESDALMAVANAYANVGRLAARQAHKLLETGAKPIELPIASLDRFSVYVNIETAQALGVYPSIQLINIAEIVGGEAKP